jgi:hypothetical protein
VLPVAARQWVSDRNKRITDPRCDIIGRALLRSMLGGAPLCDVLDSGTPEPFCCGAPLRRNDNSPMWCYGCATSSL